MAKRTKKTHPERAVLKGSGGGVCCYKGTNVIRNNKTFSKKSFEKSYVRENCGEKEGVCGT